MIHNARRATRDAIRVWCRAIRPFAYPASIIPVFLGIAVAWARGVPIDLQLAILTLLGALAAHTASNLMNDYWDYKKGVDRSGTLGGSGVLVQRILKPKAILAASIVFFVFAAVISVPLCLRVGWPLVVLIFLGFIAGAGYVLPPFGFKYRALGDVIVFSAFGVGITLGSFMIQSGSFSIEPIVYAIPFGLLVAAILHANNIRDAADDEGASIKTLASLLGVRRAKSLYALMVLGAYAFVIIGVVIGVITPGALAVMISFPLAMGLVYKQWNVCVASPREMSKIVEKTAGLNLAFGMAMIAGIIGGTLFLRSPVL